MYTENTNNANTNLEDLGPGQSSNSYYYSNGAAFNGRVYSTGPVYKDSKKKKGTFAKVMAFILCAGLIFGVGAGSALALTGHFSKEKSKTEQALTDTDKKADENTLYSQNDATPSQNGTGALTNTVTSLTPTMLNLDVAGIVKEAMPMVVSVTSTVTAKYPTMFGQMYEKSGTDAGSGIIIGENDNELLVATNYHVIGNADSGSIQIGFCDQTTAPAGLKGTDKDMDLAIVAVSKSDISPNTMNTIKISTIGDSDSLQLGEPVIAIGNGLGYGQSVSYGIVSALNREIQSESGDTNTYIQTDAAINPGNSGGALLNGKGELIGITSAKIADATVEGMGFAIPVASAKPILDELMNEETKIALSNEQRGYLGIRVATPTGVEGAYVVEVTNDSAASDSGMMVGDIITSVDGKAIASAEDLTDMLQYYEAGREITVTVLRKGQSGYGEETLYVTLAHVTD